MLKDIFTLKSLNRTLRFGVVVLNLCSFLKMYPKNKNTVSLPSTNSSIIHRDVKMKVFVNRKSRPLSVRIFFYSTFTFHMINVCLSSTSLSASILPSGCLMQTGELYPSQPKLGRIALEVTFSLLPFQTKIPAV